MQHLRSTEIPSAPVPRRTRQGARLTTFLFAFLLFLVPAVAVSTGTASAQLPDAQTNATGASPDIVSKGLNISNLQTLSNGLSFYALLACIAGICVSAGLWAMGSHGSNPGTELAGKNGLIVCCAAAFFIGALPPWINYLSRTAETADVNASGVVSNASYVGTNAQPANSAQPAAGAPSTLRTPDAGAPRDVQTLNAKYKEAANEYTQMFSGLSPEKWSDKDKSPEAQNALGRMKAAEQQLNSMGYKAVTGR